MRLFCPRIGLLFYNRDQFFHNRSDTGFHLTVVVYGSIDLRRHRLDFNVVDILPLRKVAEDFYIFVCQRDVSADTLYLINASNIALFTAAGATTRTAISGSTRACAFCNALVPLCAFA